MPKHNFNYSDALNYLNDLTRFGINLGLERMNIILDQLGNPHKHLRCIHVAGTNGKGSVASMIASGLTNSGYRVGRYTSPHLLSYRERFCIDGKDISEEDFADTIHEVKINTEDIQELQENIPTEFEVLTAAAFSYFYRNNLDICVIEVGLGGRFDATNVLDPVLSVITHIGFDHMDRLGNTLQDIAGEKCGIIKENRPVVSSLQEAEVLDVIEKTVKQQKSSLTVLGRDVSFSVGKEDEFGFLLSVSGYDNNNLDNVNIPLSGSFQHENVACAILCLWKLHDLGFNITEEGIRNGLKDITIPGRLEVVRRNPYLVLDVGHNIDAAVCLRENIERHFPYKRLIIITGLLKDKDIPGYLSHVAYNAHTLIATTPVGPRALPAFELAKIAREYTKNVLTEKDPFCALEIAMNMAGPGDLVVICGSFYLIGFMRKKIFSHKYAP